MKTLAQVRAEYIADAAAEFLSVLLNRVETGVKTEAEAHLYRSRLPRAVLLATTPHMILQASPGVYDVWSTGTNMDKVYCVDTKKQTCTCPDADPTTGKAPQGYCKHRLACFLVLRADRGIAVLKARLEGLKVPHLHPWTCGHGTGLECWDAACTDVVPTELCPPCRAGGIMPEEPVMDEEDTMPVYNEQECQKAPVYDAPAQYEERPVITPKVAPPCEATSSLNLKAKVRNLEVMWTLRSMLPGAAGDADIIARLPTVLAEMQKLGINFE